jgi:hypothetical protein
MGPIERLCFHSIGCADQQASLGTPWSVVPPASIGLSKQDSRHDECCAKHQTPAFPTQLKAGVVVSSRLRMQIVESDLSSSSSSSDDDNDDGDEESVVLVEQENEVEIEQVVVEINDMELCRDVARLKLELKKADSELINTKGTIRKLRSRSRKQLRVLKPEQMSNGAAYAVKLADVFLSAFAGTQSKKKKKKKLANELFSSLSRDNRMEDFLVGR